MSVSALQDWQASHCRNRPRYPARNFSGCCFPRPGAIDDHRGEHRVEPICKELPIAPSTCHAHAARRADPSKAPPRVRRDAVLRGEIRRVWEEDFRVYGVRKILAAARSRGDWRRPLHGGAPDAPDGAARSCSRKTSENDDQRHGRPLSARPGARRPRPTAFGSPTSPMWPLGRGSSTSPLSSTPMPGASSAGACRAPPRRASCSTRWSRRSTPEDLLKPAGGFIGSS